MKFFATTPKGLELLLVEELRQLGATDAAEKLAGVAFSGDLALAYKACLWSRLANRILLQLAEFPANTPEELYAGVQHIAWDEHLEPHGTLNINFASVQSEINHTLFGAQKVKDAIVDQLREKYQERPSITRAQPDLVLHVYLHRNTASLSIDLAGESLHRRGYRLEQTLAPLKENLAAALLLRANWPSIAANGGSLVDPMCGSGTLLIEAAMIAGDVAPGLMRDYFGFLYWKKHDAALWQQLHDEAMLRCEQGRKKIPTLIGYDEDPHAIKIALANLERANLHDILRVEQCELSQLTKPTVPTGLVIANPPYGERLGELAELKKLYALLGDQLKQHFVEWEAAVFTGNPELGKNMGIRSHHQYALFNGSLPCQLLLFHVTADKFVDRSPAANNERRIRRAERVTTEEERIATQAFVNRVQKRLKHIRRWAKQQQFQFYRIYDADLPEFAVSVDLYEEYALIRPHHIPQSANVARAKQRFRKYSCHVANCIADPASIFFIKNLQITRVFQKGFRVVMSSYIFIHLKNLKKLR